MLNAGSDAQIPLVVDLDDTLLRTDMLYECFWKGMGNDPLGTLALCWKFWRRPNRLKLELAAASGCEVATLPVDPDVQRFCQSAHDEGRDVVVASGSTSKLVHAVADRVGGIDLVFASDDRVNLTGREKAALLIERYGEGGFDYIGDSPKDIQVWKAARRCIVARPTKRMLAQISEAELEPQTIGAPWTLKDLFAGFRPRQWIKNVLLVLPVIAAHSIDPLSLLLVALGIVSYSAAASAIYIVNDLTDLDADRLHPTKSKRVFAVGRVPIRVGMLASAALGLFSLLVAALLGWKMLAVIVVYILTTLAYSMRLKRARWVDVTTLGVLYTLRVVAGAAATQVPASGWLIAFIFPLFLTLACVKRLTELARATTDGPIPGRKYQKSDRGDLLNMSILGATASAGVFIAYSYSGTAAILYDSVWMLRLVVVSLVLWLIRMISTGWTGLQAYDPIEFALRDKVGLLIIVVAVATLLVAV